MRVLWGLPWVGLVLAGPTLAEAQMTVDNEPGAPARGGPRAHEALTLSDMENGGHAMSPDAVPEYHTVVHGDTLWDISGYYLSNPWRWPQVWARNPQITNPHWIFPGDQVRLRLGGELRALPAATTPTPDRPRTVHGFRNERQATRYPPGTVFMSEEAWATPDAIDAAGTIVGSPDDVMLLSEGNQVYVQFFHRVPTLGESYTIYHEAQATHGGDRNVGRVIRVLGTAIVDAWDAQRQIATARITESLDTIERGERVILVNRSYGPVRPATNNVDLTANVVATSSPRTIVGSQYVVIVDRGSQDGVVVGNRMFIVHRGDPWREHLTRNGERRLPLDQDGDGTIDVPPDSHFPSDSSLPPEIRGEIIVIGVHRESSVCLVTRSAVEIQVGDGVVMRRGY